MQRCSFSETQFVFQYVFEHYNKFPNSPFPFFPDTVNEGRYYGFDLCIKDLFLQFKVVNLYEQSDAKSKKTSLYWDAFRRKNFQMMIYASKKQYRLLKQISFNPRYQESVFYVAPCFFTRADLMKHYIGKTIIDNCAHFSVNTLPNSLRGEHKIVYTKSSNYGVLFSDPQEIKLSKNILENITPIQKTYSILSTAFFLSQKIMEIDSSLKIFIEKTDQQLPQQFVKSIQSCLLSEFDIYWFPVIDMEYKY